MPNLIDQENTSYDSTLKQKDIEGLGSMYSLKRKGNKQLFSIPK
jgi:hypothetical protein